MKESTVIASSQFLGSLTDRGVSSDALALQRHFREIVAQIIHDSESAGAPRRRLLDALTKVYEDCSEQNWDGYGASKVELDTLHNAWFFLDTLPAFAPLPEVTVEPDGEIAFEWYRTPRYVFSVSVGNGNTISYAGLFGHSKNHGTEYLCDELPKTIKGNLGRLLAQEG